MIQNKSLFGILFAMLSITACSHSYLLKDKKNSIAIRQVNLLAVAYHRPAYAPAENEDFSHKDRQLDCQLASAYWSDLTASHQERIDCLNSVGDVPLHYRLVSEVQPYLEIDPEEKKNPECVVKLFPKIPIPREVYYLGTQSDMSWSQNPLGCYSSSFNLNAGMVFSTQAPKKIKKIMIPSSADRPLQSKNDLQLWLMMTVFNVLKADEQATGKLWGLPVPDAVCRTCFQRDRLFNDKYSGQIQPVFSP